jgi:hypothetical protein
MGTKAEKAAAKKLDREIERIYYESCAGVQVSILDIPRVFDAGRKAAAEGRDVKEAIVSFVASVRKN